MGWGVELAPEHIQREYEKIFFLSFFPVCCLPTPPLSLLSDSISFTPAHLLSHMFLTVLILSFFGSPLSKLLPLARPFFLAKWISSFITWSISLLSLSKSVSVSWPLDSLHPSIMSSFSILASLVSSSTPSYLSLDIIHAFPPALFVDLGSHLSLDSGHTLPPLLHPFGYPEPPCWFVSVDCVLEQRSGGFPLVCELSPQAAVCVYMDVCVSGDGG